jgi:hypothetical protein
MNAFALTRTSLPRIFTLDCLTPRVLATNKVLPDFDGAGFRSLSEIRSLPFSTSTFMSSSRLIVISALVSNRNARRTPDIFSADR